MRASSEIERCSSNAPFTPDPEWEALSEQCQNSLQILQGPLTLPTSHELKLIGLLQPGWQKLIRRTSYQLINPWDGVAMAKVLQFTYQHTRSLQVLDFMTHPRTTDFYEILRFSSYPAVAGVLSQPGNWNLPDSREQVIIVSPLIYRHHDTNSNPRINIGKINSLRAFTSAQPGKPSVFRESNITRSWFELFIGRHSDVEEHKALETSAFSQDYHGNIRVDTSFITVRSHPTNPQRQLAWRSHDNVRSVANVMVNQGIPEYAGAEFGPHHEIWDFLENGDMIGLHACPQGGVQDVPPVRLELKTEV